ncbi:MAG: hypothetical protein J1E60_06045 [Christensenellaceae bacterium]|nr:hypothetical protein [Christensenellaceae bacterium]
MGVLSSLFGKKDKNMDAQEQKSVPETKRNTIKAPTFHLKGKPDINGLYPSELVMLAVAERYSITETQFSGYLTYTYEIANPLKMLKDLQSRGFLKIGSPIDVLPNLKLPELKELATALNTTVKGKKADIIAQLSGVDEETLGKFVKERSWKLTENGEKALKANPYIQYFLDKHNYNISEVGVDIWSVNEEFVKDPKRPYRDIIYRQLNNQMNKASIAFQKNPMSGTTNTHQYCECYRIMGLFVEEEKSYENASDLYFQYLFKRINIGAGLQLLINYQLFKNDKKYQADSIKRYYDDIQLYPFHKTEILRLLDELNITGDAIRNALITSFKRTGDSGIMSVEEATDFIILELSGDVDESRDLSYKLAKRAVKKLK